MSSDVILSSPPSACHASEGSKLLFKSEVGQSSPPRVRAKRNISVVIPPVMASPSSSTLLKPMMGGSSLVTGVKPASSLSGTAVVAPTKQKSGSSCLTTTSSTSSMAPSSTTTSTIRTASTSSTGDATSGRTMTTTTTSTSRVVRVSSKAAPTPTSSPVADVATSREQRASGEPASSLSSTWPHEDTASCSRDDGTTASSSSSSSSSSSCSSSGEVTPSLTNSNSCVAQSPLSTSLSEPMPTHELAAAHDEDVGKGIMTTGGDGVSAEALVPEDDNGAIEYKLKLVNPSESRFQHLVSQMKFRLGEGQGEAVYEIGVADSGVPKGLSPDDLNASLLTLKRMASELNAECTVLRTREGEEGQVAEILVRKVADEQFFELRVAVVGNVDSGKSTLLGVLTRGGVDNGRGLARLNIFRHKHEIETGRTSAISQEIMGFDSSGNIVNYTSLRNQPTWSEICEASSKVVTFIDLAGHERYLKTTLFGLTGHAPDFCMMSVGANMGVVGMAKEHFGIALALKVPVFIVVTKIDMCPPNILKQTMDQLNKLLKSPGTRKVPIIIRNEDDVLVASRSLLSESICPIFQVSNVTGESLDLLRMFINLLPARNDWESKVDEPAEFSIDDSFSVTGVGTVVSGTVMAGTISVNQTLLLGPNQFGVFEAATVKSIQAKRMSVKTVRAGHAAAFALKKIKRSQIRKGMYLMDPALNPRATTFFEAEILVLFHSTTIGPNYQAVIHCNTTRQAARIVHMSHEVLRTGMKAYVIFEFMYKPEYLKPSARLLFREGRTKGIGKVARVFPDGWSLEVDGVGPKVAASQGSTTTSSAAGSSAAGGGASAAGGSGAGSSTSSTSASSSSSSSSSSTATGSASSSKAGESAAK